VVNRAHRSISSTAELRRFAEATQATHPCQALDRDRVTRQQQIVLSALQSRYAALTPREREVMSLVVTDMLNKQIASGLGTSERPLDGK
jgi:FixJ family two-component response regulator